MAEMPGDAFRAVAPEEDFLLHINDAHTGQKAFQDVATSVELIKGRHACGVRVLWRVIGKNSLGLQRLRA
jgi:hypothetical protein